MREFFLSSVFILVPTLSLCAVDEPVNYSGHMKPIFRQHCLKCHGEDNQEAGINLQNYAALLKGGSGGKIVEAGRASQSLLFLAITNGDPDGRMPPNSPPLAKEKIELIRKWIDSGLRQTATSQSMVKSRDLTFTPSATAGSKPAGPPPMPGSLSDVLLKSTGRPLPVLAMDASPWAPVLAISGWEHVRLIHTETQKEIGRLAFPEGEPHVVRFSRDGTVLLVAGGRPVESGLVVLFDIRTGKRLAEIGDEIDTVLAADLSPNQRLAALGGSGRVVKVYSTTDGKLRYRLTKHTDWITALAFSPNGETLATADRAGGIHLWNAESGGIVLNLIEHKAAVRSLAWRADGKLLASTGEDGRVVWWDVADGFPAINRPNAHPPQRMPGTFGKIPNGVLAGQFDSKGNLITVGRDRMVRWWNPAGNGTKAMPLEQAIPNACAVSVGGVAITGDTSGSVRFFK